MSEITILLANGQTRQAQGKKFTLAVSGVKLELFLETATQDLTHAPSGRLIGNLKGTKATHFKSYHRMTDEGAAAYLIEGLMAKLGRETVLTRLEQAPILEACI